MRRLRWLLLIMVVPILYWGFLSYREHRFDGQIVAAAARYRLDPALVKAVIWRESRFRPNERGRAGELGLMQVREAAFLDWASAEHVTNLEHKSCLDPTTNTLVGAWYLQKLMGRYQQADNPLPYALADYNAGRGNVLKWRTGPATTNSAAFVQQIAFPSTKAYVQTVLKRYRHYRAD
jgi:soluble lytic murein transglycosylase